MTEYYTQPLGITRGLLIISQLNYYTVFFYTFFILLSNFILSTFCSTVISLSYQLLFDVSYSMSMQSPIGAMSSLSKADMSSTASIAMSTDGYDTTAETELSEALRALLMFIGTALRYKRLVTDLYNVLLFSFAMISSTGPPVFAATYVYCTRSSYKIPKVICTRGYSLILASFNSRIREYCLLHLPSITWYRKRIFR